MPVNLPVDASQQARPAVVEYLRRELIGPRDGELEEVTDEPFNRYTMGTLYPRNEQVDDITATEDQDDTSGADASERGDQAQEGQADDPIVLANQYLPASMALSFYLRGNSTILVTVAGARYFAMADAETVAVTEGNQQQKRRRRRPRWKRQPLVDDSIRLSPESKATSEASIFEGTASVRAIWRQGSDGWLVTVAIVNARVNENGGRPEVEDCLHQVEVRCRPDAGGMISAYPRPTLLTDDPEEHALDVLYRRQVAYGVGHGCSVMWGQAQNGGVGEIWTDFLPTAEVAPVSFGLPGYERVLNLHFLTNSGNATADLVAELDRFVDGYRDWIDGLLAKNPDITDDMRATCEELLRRARTALERMRAGVRLIERDPQVRRAFGLANQAMLMQMLHSRQDYAGTRRRAGDRQYVAPTVTEAEAPRWRPFQLAFLLLTMSSVAFPEDLYRDTVDLIWFPTGGGKTEAYLAVTAFLIMYRRLVYGPPAAGTAVLMRYTLRLLTTQQFQRAATLICACELLRREEPDDPGTDPITIGLWVGGSTTPNTYQDALDKFDALLADDSPGNPFQLEWCPWCGTEIVPERHVESKDLYGIRASASSFAIFCPNRTCLFHDELPVSVIDTQVYGRPPTLLLATVDKFARLPWEERVGEIFGKGERRPPDLIIQDELHLISGPLGTIVGLYETAIDALASWEGTRPKILASTATIRRADAQCNGLYAREVAQFPPSGLEASDSYFAQVDTSKPGRLYVGVMGPAHTASTTMIRTSAALLQAPIELRLSGDDLDAYWTMVAYHNSLRELGKSRTFASDDIPARIKVIAEDEARLRSLDEDNVAELTSNIDAVQLSSMLWRLKVPAGEQGAVSFLLCTNMLSVGVDVPRLGLMLVNGQPKSTSEYIQATSRVGRGAVSGLVVTVYSPSKPRDRSHYERFAAYHNSLYRQVEPTSVTPFTLPARERALHAVLVSLVRHRGGLPGNLDAGSFEMDQPVIERIRNLILDRVGQVDEQEEADTAEALNKLLDEWDMRAERLGQLLEYSSQHRSKEVLLINVDELKQRGWKTLQSMRNIDVSCNVTVMGAWRETTGAQSADNKPVRRRSYPRSRR